MLAVADRRQGELGVLGQARIAHSGTGVEIRALSLACAWFIALRAARATGESPSAAPAWRRRRLGVTVKVLAMDQCEGEGNTTRRRPCCTAAFLAVRSGEYAVPLLVPDVALKTQTTRANKARP